MTNWDKNGAKVLHEVLLDHGVEYVIGIVFKRQKKSVKYLIPLLTKMVFMKFMVHN